MKAGSGPARGREAGGKQILFMEEKSHGILKKYLKQYRLTGLMFLIYVGIFALIFALYDLEIEAVLYGAALCILLTAAVLGVHFFLFREKHRKRQRILRNILLLLEELPEPCTLAEEDYQEMLRSLKADFDRNLNAWQNQRRESMDYYTAWVHQIKTPVSVMRMILQREDTEQNRELMAELFRIEQYVEMVLGYLRLGNDSSDFVFQEYDLDRIIKQAIHKYASQFVRNRIRLFYEPVDMKVLTDEKWLVFILEQILSNAVKYAPRGTVFITVTPQKVLEIRDTGIGIAPEDVPRVFEKGFTGYNGRADKKSTGLGLYLCRTAAEKLSHKIAVRSVAGEGTVVSIDLGSEYINHY